jgi:hypothetical protein
MGHVFRFAMYTTYPTVQCNAISKAEMDDQFKQNLNTI